MRDFIRGAQTPIDSRHAAPDALRTAPEHVPSDREHPKAQRRHHHQAKGRPMLTWVGKSPGPRARSTRRRPSSGLTPPAASAPLCMRRTGATGPRPTCPGRCLLYHGDNKDVLAHLLLANGFRGKVKFIIDRQRQRRRPRAQGATAFCGAKGTVKIDGGLRWASRCSTAIFGRTTTTAVHV